MRKNIQKIFISILVMHSVGVSADANTAFGVDKIVLSLQNGGSDLVVTADNILGFLIGLLYFIAVVFAIYAGFMILTSGGDEERVKKGKKVLIYVVVGLIVIFLASNLIRWIIAIMSREDIVGTTTML